MKYSVVVPIYNTFDYAQRIVEWFIQEVSARTEQDAELILVDDGSKQGPNYTIDHPSIRLIRKENGGVSSARNVGIENARGEFVLFLDSDDKYQSGLFSYLDKVLLERTNLDTILFSFEKVSDDKSEQAQNRAQH
ncbi:glycosyltransferase [Vibrio scophthalmi]|uniref:glycosyltransferase family 2 protein n=1 Tax=Vibrio scophthalmi TaxID=45658 RepID=UPI00349F3B7C